MVRRFARRLVRGGWVVAIAASSGSVVFTAQNPPAAQTPAALPSAKQIIDKFVTAMGGTVAFKGTTSMHARGTFTITGQNMSGDIEMIAARPNKLLTRITVPAIGVIEEGYDGKVGWSNDPFRGPAIVSGRGLDERADEAWFDAPLHGADFVKEMSVVGKEEFDKRQVYRVKVISNRGVETFELFDAETGLQAGAEAVRDTPFGTVPTTTVYRDAQRFGPLTFPSKVVARVLGQEQVVTFKTYIFNSVPPSTFDLPAPIKALIK